MSGPRARSLPPTAKQMQTQRIQKRKRTGSLIIECVVASAILASCSIALLKWTQSENQFKRQANTQTAAVLLANNAADRLTQTTTEDAITFANRVASELSKQQRLGMVIASSEFNNSQESGPEISGIHFTITVSEGNVPITVKHSWKLDAFEDLTEDSSASSGTIAPFTEQQEGTANE